MDLFDVREYEREMFSEYYDNVVCDKCGELIRPDKMIGNVCSDCHMAILDKDDYKDLELLEEKFNECVSEVR